jgi:hypothetical protein
MEDCCCRGEAAGEDAKCPLCGAVGKPVATQTVKHIVKPEFLELAGKAGFRFCSTAACEVVYFHPEGERLEKKDVRVRVGLKDRAEPVALCYCFGFTEAMVREEIHQTGRCMIPESITAEIKAGHCACEVRNPQGSCCLGNVTSAVKRLLGEARAEKAALREGTDSDERPDTFRIRRR